MEPADSEFSCFSLAFNSNNLPQTVTFTSETTYEAGDALPTFDETNQAYLQACGNADGDAYTGIGLNSCYGLSSEQIDFLWVQTKAYLYLPVEGASAQFGHRWQKQTEYQMWVSVAGEMCTNGQSY